MEVEDVRARTKFPSPLIHANKVTPCSVSFPFFLGYTCTGLNEAHEFSAKLPRLDTQL